MNPRCTLASRTRRLLPVINEVTWDEYVRAVSEPDSGRAVAARIGQSESTISRWKNGTVVPEPRQAVQFARAYERNPLEALIAAGYLTAEEAASPIEVPRALQLSEFSDLELAQEMVRRVEHDRDGHELLTREVDPDHPALSDDM